MQKQHIEAFFEPLLGRHRSEIAVVAHAPLIHVTRISEHDCVYVTLQLMNTASELHVH